MSKLVLKSIFIIVVSILFAAYVESYSYAPPYFKDNTRLLKVQKIFPAIDKLYSQYASKNHFPGYAFGIILDGQLIYIGSGGYANLENKIPATSKTMFRIASMSKSFTAMAILQLRDAGKLNLDDPISRFIPEFKQQPLTKDAPVITIRNLLTHSAGFPQDDPDGDRKLDITNKAFLALLKRGVSFANVTGVTYEYSNLGFAILGYIIQKVSGIPYQEYIAKHIWAPLHMTQASFEFASIPKKQLALGYEWKNNKWKSLPLLHDGSFASAGGMITSIHSFSRYVALHQQAWPPRDEIDTGPLKRSSIREMQQAWRFNELDLPYQNLDKSNCAMVAAYGYGLRWLRNCTGKIYVGHVGGLPGFGSSWLIMPDYGIGVILFANVTYAKAEPINLQVLNTLVKKAFLEPRELPPSQALITKKTALLQLLPSWKNAQTSGIFARNFFLDYSINDLKKETTKSFIKAGKIIKITPVIPTTQLSGYFTIKGEHANLKITFALSPEYPALIQSYKLEEEKMP